MIDLRNKQVNVFGKKNTGKSGLVHYWISNIPGSYAIFDVGDEHTDYKEDDLVFVPTVKRGKEAKEQLQEFVDFVTDNRETFDYLIIEEVNRYHNKNAELTGALGELIDMSAHMDDGMGIIMVARRPVQVHTDITGLADTQIFFRLTGVNDIRRLDSIHSGLGERVSQLEDYEFMVLDEPNPPFKHEPVDISSLNHTKGY